MEGKESICKRGARACPKREPWRQVTDSLLTLVHFGIKIKRAAGEDPGWLGTVNADNVV